MSDLADRFLGMHVPGEPLLLANAYDAGTAKVLAHVGFEALATTSSGHAGTLGRRDGRVTRDEAIAHAAALAAATPLPLNADLEHGFADDPGGVAETIRLAAAAAAAGREFVESSAALIDEADLRESFLRRVPSSVALAGPAAP